MMKANFSKHYWAIQKRIQRLPKLLEKTADTITKKDAKGFIKEYQEGIRNSNFGLEQLSPLTVDKKQRLGYSKPQTPLYGLGDSTKNSYINAFKIRKIKKGYRVYLSNAKHHKANLSLKELFWIHEYGALIKVNLANGGVTIIRIPPRPTRQKAFKRYLARRLKEENVEKVKKTIINYLKTGNYKEVK